MGTGEEGKSMPRRKLTDKEKQAMQRARVVASKERADAKDALANNPQFLNEKFWRNVDFELLENVEAAIEDAKEETKRSRILELESTLAKLRSETK